METTDLEYVQHDEAKNRFRSSHMMKQRIFTQTQPPALSPADRQAGS